MRGRFATAGTLSAAVLMTALASSAQEIVYEPVNPSFGGDSFNSSHLLAIANSQNDYRDPNQKSSTNSQADQFIRQLQSRLLSSLAGEVNDAIFGDNPQQAGTITFGDQIIEFSRGLESVHLTITDLATGNVTEIEIPLLYAGGGEGSTGPTGLGSILGAPTPVSNPAPIVDDAPLSGGLDLDGGIY